MRKIHLVYTCLLSVIVSCRNSNQENHGAIVLGDSATIVTETNPEYLADFVADINVQNQDTIQAKPADTIAAKMNAPVDTPQKSRQTDEAPATGKGLTIDFAEVSVFIPNIETRSFKNQNVKTLNGVSYQLTSGTLQGNKLILKGATLQKVSQRYISTLVVIRAGEKLELDNMDETTSWKELNGSKGVYPIKGIEPSRLSYKKTSVGAIRTAVSRAARAERMSRNEIKEWENSVRKLRSVNQAPVSVALQSVMWRIEGRDAKGKSFRKEIRIDMPL